jgi:hypothetical protein
MSLQPPEPPSGEEEIARLRRLQAASAERIRELEADARLRDAILAAGRRRIVLYRDRVQELKDRIDQRDQVIAAWSRVSQIPVCDRPGCLRPISRQGGPAGSYCSEDQPHLREKRPDQQD